MEIKSMQDHNEQESIKEAWTHQDYSGYEQKRRCSPRFMINKQYRKKTLKGSFLTKQGEGLILKIIVRRRQRHNF
jgi:hypothetical protein